MDRRTHAQPHPEAEGFDTVHAHILRSFDEAVRMLGGDPETLLRDAGIEAAALTERRPGPSYRAMVELLELAAARLACPDFGMRLALLQKGSAAFGPLGPVMRHSRTFGEALTYASEHSYAHSLAARVWLKPSIETDGLFAGHDILLDRLPNRSQTMEQVLLLGHLAAMEMTGGAARVRRVHFRHQPVSPPKLYRRYFGCEVRFGQNEDGVLFFRRDLNSPIVAADADAYRDATALIEAQFTRQRPPLHAEARGLIMRYLGGDCTNDRIAAELNLHTRTMHRRLRAEGTSFQQVKDEVRRDVMLYFLQQTDIDFTQISERLGFAEQSVMTRNCRRWFADSPTRVRLAARRRDAGRTDGARFRQGEARQLQGAPARAVPCRRRSENDGDGQSEDGVSERLCGQQAEG